MNKIKQMQMNHYYNNASVAQLGHGKWKRALGHTLLLIGFLMGFGMMSAYAQTPTGGLYMNKTWTPDPTDPTGASGTIRLETFVTGEKIITEAHVPTDIVVVLDQSGSMSDLMGSGISRLQALKNALGVFIDSIQADAVRYNCDHRMAVVGFAGGNYNYTSGTGYYHNTEILSTNEEVKYRNNAGEDPTVTVAQYRDALVHVTTSNNNNVNSRLRTATNRLEASGGTMMQYGLRLAYEILNNRDTTQFNAGTEADPVMVDRSQVVVFFTDGYPGRTPAYARSGNYGSYQYSQYFAQGRDYGNQTVMCQSVADQAVIQARNIKSIGATVFSVGVFDGANPSMAYVTTRKNASSYYTENTNGGYSNQNYRIYYWEPTPVPAGSNSGDAAANGLMHFISSDYSEAETPGTTPWSTLTLSNDGRNAGKYFSASTPEDLTVIFTAIASESGGSSYDLGMGTVVQDVIAPSFQLNIPEGATASTTIKAYAPKCNGKNGNMFTFEPEIDGTAGRLIINNNGVVVDTEGRENRLADGVVNFDEDEQTLTFTNFNFAAMYVAQEVDDHGNPIVDDQGNPICIGRKLVMLIPLEIADGSWGDGIHTNGEMSVIFPNGDESNPIYFNNPTANVLGSVWTEVIVQKPTDFDANNIDSPEDLAWFISEVNGRIGYNVKDGYNSNNVASHPQLNGRLTADIDMSAHNWVPIGCGWQVEIDPATGYTRFVEDENGNYVHMTYEGTFDGNGYVITGLKNNASKYYKQITQDVGGVVVFPGMFSDVNGTVKNVFVLDADFRGKHHNEHFVHHGIIADTLEMHGKIFNCEAAGRITCNNDDVPNDAQLIYGGLVGLNNGGTIHSCMAMAELTAYTMGGMIGENIGSFSNGFTNGVYNYLDNNVTGKYAGGIAAINTGTINNCYVRFERENQNLDKTTFGQITGNGSFTNAYSPEDLMGNVPTNSTPGTRTYKATEPAQWARTFYHDNTLDDTRDYMIDALNDEVGEGQSEWKRTTAGGYLRSPNGGNINGDYPVLQIDQFNSIASADGIRLDYAASLKDMLHRHNNGNMNENTQISNEYTQYNADYYKVTEHPTIYKGAINLYDNDSIALPQTGGKDGVADNCTAEGVVVYIDEDVSLLQDESSVINAFTGQSIKVFGGVYGNTQAGDRWHNVSSSLKNSGFGWYYTNNEQVEHNFEANPCGMRLDQTNDDVDIFPTDMSTYHQSDFYCFFEPEYHWVNFRRNGLSHWHMDDYTKQINYYHDKPNVDFSEFEQIFDNETQFIPGKGYLLAFNASAFDSVEYRGSQLLQNYGTLNNGDVNIPVTCTEGIELTGRQGYNLLGNPYQSYLDFEEFVDGNENLWGTDDQFAQTYAVYDPEYSKYIQYKSNSSKGSLTANQFINMHQGFFIKTSQSTTAHFTNDMRTNDGTPNFRGEKPAFPLINFIVADNEGNTDVAVIELNRNENEGATKLRMGSAKGRIYFRYNKENLAIFFRDNAKENQILNFVADENGNYTLSWNTANADFNSLTLIDNITGVKTDMLAHDHYTFEGRTDDYDTRFKIVFDLNNYNEDEVVESETFAFFNEGNLIVNGEGYFDVIDVLGRVVYAAQLTDTQNTVSLPHNLSGVCLLRISNGDKVKVQKMYVR